MEKKIHALEKNKSSQFVTLPLERKQYDLNGCTKLNSANGILERYKAALVAKGYNRKKMEFNHDETIY